MRRVWFAVLGGVFGALGVAFAAVFWGDSLVEPSYAVTFALWFGASILYVLGGLGVAVGDFEWYQLVGAGNVCLGLQMVVRVPFALADGTAGTESAVAALASGLGGLALAYIGVDWFRGGRHFDLSAFGEAASTGRE